MLRDHAVWYHDGDEEVDEGHAKKLEDLRNAMGKLQPRDREILDRSVVEEKDSSSVARELSIKPGAVRVALHRPLRRLRKLMLGDKVSDVPEDDR